MEFSVSIILRSLDAKSLQITLQTAALPITQPANNQIEQRMTNTSLQTKLRTKQPAAAYTALD